MEQQHAVCSERRGQLQRFELHQHPDGHESGTGSKSRILGFGCAGRGRRRNGTDWLYRAPRTSGIDRSNRRNGTTGTTGTHRANGCNWHAGITRADGCNWIQRTGGIELAGDLEQQHSIRSGRRCQLQRFELHQHPGRHKSGTGYKARILEFVIPSRSGWCNGSNRRDWSTGAAGTNRRQRASGAAGTGGFYGCHWPTRITRATRATGCDGAGGTVGVELAGSME